MCESVDLIPLAESKALVLEMPKPEEMFSETMELVEFLANVPKVAVTASITKVFGPCPLGVMPSNALNRSTACESLYASREVTFKARKPEGELMERPG